MSDIPALFKELQTAIYNASTDEARRECEAAMNLLEKLEAALQKEVEDAHQIGYDIGYDAGAEDAREDFFPRTH